MSGLLRFEHGRLWLQHHTTDTVLGVLRSRPRETALPLDKVVEIRSRWSFKYWWTLWVTPTIELQLDSLGLAREIPGAEGGHVELLVRWQHRRQARALVADVRSALAELRYQKLNAEIEQMARRYPQSKAHTDRAPADQPRHGWQAPPGKFSSRAPEEGSE